jgi:hypothetical protein
VENISVHPSVQATHPERQKYWYHLVQIKIGDDVELGCSCCKDNCICQQFLQVYRAEQFPPGAYDLAKGEPLVNTLQISLTMTDRY